MPSKRPKCLVCGKRPRYNGSRYCLQCANHIESESNHKGEDPFRYVVYRGAVVGFYWNGGGTLKPVTLKRNPDYLPKSKVVNLDRYCPGFTREQVKALKRSVKRLTLVK